MFNPLSRREVLRFGAYTTVGGALTPGISMAQAIVTEGKGLVLSAPPPTSPGSRPGRARTGSASPSAP